MKGIGLTRVPRSIIAAFSIGSLGTGIYLTVPSVLLLYYMTEQLGVSPGLAGVAVFLPRLWDLATDPFMGWISDRTRSPIGRRRPYLLAGAILTSLSFVFLFSAPEFKSEWTSFWYVFLVYIASATAYTVFAVPYLSMPAEMSTDSHERSSIMAWRMTFAMVGVLAGSASAPALLEAFGGGRHGYAAMGWTLGAICALSMLVAFFGTRRAPVHEVPEEQAEGVSVLVAFRDTRFRLLSLAYFIQLGGFGVFTAASPYFVVYVTGHSEGDIGSLFLCLLAGTLVSIFAWNLLGRAIGKTRAYMLAALVAIIGLGSLLLPMSMLSWPIILMLTIIIGAGFGGMQLMPFAMLTDIINLVRSEGDDAAGAFTGVWTAVEKGGLALGPVIVGALLGASGFQSGSIIESGQNAYWVQVALGGIPTLCVLISLPAVWKFGKVVAQDYLDAKSKLVSAGRNN
jgi:GPH family glycoside/pentoside/hexuronide:cation symporter